MKILFDCKKCGKCCNIKYTPKLDKFRETKSNGDCIYLIEGLCSIYNDRPYQCSMYPFTININYDQNTNQIKTNLNRKLCIRERIGD